MFAEIVEWMRAHWSPNTVLILENVASLSRPPSANGHASGPDNLSVLVHGLSKALGYFGKGLF